MRLQELIELRQRKKKVPKEPEPYTPGWDNLNWIKERAHEVGQRLAGSLQLFMPKESSLAKTVRDKRLDNLANKFAYDDEGNLKPNYKDWEEKPTIEGAPILKPGKAITPPGNNKPHADLWTSTAKRLSDGTFTSDWVRWVQSEQSKWMSLKGHIYRVKPGALILELNSDLDAEQVQRTFLDLGTAKLPEPAQYSYDRGRVMRTVFPWDQIVKHFDAVWHSGHRWHGDEFMYGWDVESTAWLDTSFLQYMGEVPIAQKNMGDRDD